MQEILVENLDTTDKLSEMLASGSLPAMAGSEPEKTGKKARRTVCHFTESARKAILAEVASGRLTMTGASREYNISLTTLYRWHYQYNNTSPKKIPLMDIKEIQLDRQAYEKRIADLEQLIGQQTVKIDFLEKALLLAVPDDEAKKNSIFKPLFGLPNTEVAIHTP